MGPLDRGGEGERESEEVELGLSEGPLFLGDFQNRGPERDECHVRGAEGEFERDSECVWVAPVAPQRSSGLDARGRRVLRALQVLEALGGVRVI